MAKGYWFPFMTEVFDSGAWRGLSCKAAKAYPALCSFADWKTGECFPSMRTLAKRAGVSPGWISAAIEELVAAKLVERWSGGADRSNRYRILHWQPVPEAGTPCNPSGYTGATQPGTKAYPDGAQNYNQVTTINLTTARDPGKRRRGAKAEEPVPGTDRAQREAQVREAMTHLSAEERSALRTEAETEAGDLRPPFRDAFIDSAMLLRLAKRMGIERF